MRSVHILIFFIFQTFFRSRDAGRMEQTALHIAHLLWAEDVENAKHLLSHARDGLLALTEDAWSLLQQRHPGVHPHLAKPHVSRLSVQFSSSPLSPQDMVSVHGARSVAPVWDIGSKPTGPNRKLDLLPGATGKRNNYVDAEPCSSDISTRDCTPALSRTTSSSAPTRTSMHGSGKDRLLRVVSIEEGGSHDEDELKDKPVSPVQDRLLKVADIGEEEYWFGSLSGSVCNCPCAGRAKGSEDCDLRLQSELQVMLSGTLDEVFQSLLHNTRSVAVGQATLQLEKAREDVLKWTVKRWNTSDC